MTTAESEKMALPPTLRQPDSQAEPSNISYKPMFDTLNNEIFHRDTSYVCHQSKHQLRVFSLFPRLPVELQLYILELAHPPNKKRLLTVTLREDPRFQEVSSRPSLQASLHQVSNALGNVISGVRYRVVLHHLPRTSLLLQICQRSREAALRRYHIRLPANPGQGHDSPLLYINPTHDTLYLDSFDVSPSTLAGFLHDLRAYDTQHIGLCNLALNNQFDDNLQILQGIAPDVLKPVEVTSYKQSLLALSSLWFIHLLDNDNRYIARQPTPFTGNCMFHCHRRLVTQAMPIFPEACEYHLIAADPRLIKPCNLEQVRFSSVADPKAGPCRWELMENKFGVGKKSVSQPEREISYVLAVDATENHAVCSANHHLLCGQQVVRDMRALDDYLSREKRKPKFLVGKDQGEEEDLDISVAGFWIFPQDVLNGREPEPAGVHLARNILNFSGRSPALGVFYLPDIHLPDGAVSGDNE